MVTVIDDDLVRTHDDARDLIREAAGGLLVVIEKTRDESGHTRSRRYVLTHPSHPSIPLSMADCYSLPFHATAIANSVKQRASEAVRSSAYILPSR